jgi:hypothetical protein
MSACRDALRAAGIPIDPRQSPLFQAFWFIPEPTGKWCRRCHSFKAFEDFPLHAPSADGRYSYCKACHSRVNKERRAA